jgi:DNA-binding MarR family transcriptional regulator/N-acetylglutamate synthase-like GNAT family acetyltransferase
MQEAVGQVRSFNRLVTERVGALEDRYLSSERPLGEARVLWEIGPDGCDVRALRSRLALDSGYLSRLLRSLEAAGLVAVERSEDDGRVRTAQLTARGRAKREELDRRSDDLARSFLEPLSVAKRDRLVAAMAEVELLLTAGLVEIADADPAGPDGRHCLEAYFAELGRRFDVGFDLAHSHSGSDDDLRPPQDVFLVARLRGDPVGCGGLKLRPGKPAELRRMWVSGEVRGLGIGRRLLNELEARAEAAGARAVRLETNRSLTEAVALYRASGYAEIPAFNDELYADHWFEKRLAQPSARKK